MEDHDRWFGFAESKVKKIVQLLENFDRAKLQGILELRPHARTYSIKSEVREDFPVSDVYYIGIRVKNGVEINKDLVDLTGTRQRFFDGINE